MEHQHSRSDKGHGHKGRCRTETASSRGKWHGDSSPEPRKNEKSSKTLSVTFILDSSFTPTLDDTEFSINPRLLLRDGVVCPEIVPTCPKMSLSRKALSVPTQQAVTWCSTWESFLQCQGNYWWP